MKKGFATFLLLIPIIALALGLTAIYTSIEKERLETQLQLVHSLRQEQIDNSIKKSLKEILEYYSESFAYAKLQCEDANINGVPVPGKITLTAGKISGLGISTSDSWQGFLTEYYAKQGFDVKFYITYKKQGVELFSLPLTQQVSIPNLNVKVAGPAVLLTCSDVTREVTNSKNLGLTVHLQEKPIEITYAVKDLQSEVTWTRKISAGLYLKNSK